MFADRARIVVKAGNGGNGSVSFRREKYIPNGVPMAGTEAAAAILSLR